MAFAIENIVIHINKIHKTDGVSLVNPSEILGRESTEEEIEFLKAPNSS